MRRCAAVERTERIQVVLTVDCPLGSGDRNGPVIQADGTQLAPCRCCQHRLPCSASPHFLLIPLNLSQMPHTLLLLLCHQLCPFPPLSPVSPCNPDVPLSFCLLILFEFRSELCQRAIPQVSSAIVKLDVKASVTASLSTLTD